MSWLKRVKVGDIVYVVNSSNRGYVTETVVAVTSAHIATARAVYDAGNGLHTQVRYGWPSRRIVEPTDQVVAMWRLSSVNQLLWKLADAQKCLNTAEVDELNQLDTAVCQLDGLVTKLLERRTHQ